MSHCRCAQGALAYAVFGILLNSVGPVILQSITTFHVDKLTASTLEAFKDITIAVVSFTIAAHVPRRPAPRHGAGVDLRRAGCGLVPMAGHFWAVRAMFLCAGMGFALMKVAVYAAVGQFSGSTSGHARMLGIIEAMFMVAVLACAWIFAWFIDPMRPDRRAGCMSTGCWRRYAGRRRCWWRWPCPRRIRPSWWRKSPVSVIC
jgi:hypothetical protein